MQHRGGGLPSWGRGYRVAIPLRGSISCNGVVRGVPTPLLRKGSQSPYGEASLATCVHRLPVACEHAIFVAIPLRGSISCNDRGESLGRLGIPVVAIPLRGSISCNPRRLSRPSHGAWCTCRNLLTEKHLVQPISMPGPGGGWRSCRNPLTGKHLWQLPDGVEVEVASRASQSPCGEASFATEAHRPPPGLAPLDQVAIPLRGSIFCNALFQGLGYADTGTSRNPLAGKHLLQQHGCYSSGKAHIWKSQSPYGEASFATKKVLTSKFAKVTESQSPCGEASFATVTPKKSRPGQGRQKGGL